jgi:hypothetical protein
MQTESDGQTTENAPAVYEPPCALRLDQTPSGSGGAPCGGPGSGADYDCSTGFSPDYLCDSNGSGAGSCLSAGNIVG